MSDLNVARLVPHNEQDALLAAACPLSDMVAGVGHVFHRGEYWLLIYESCGHDQYFRRTADGLYDLADVEPRSGSDMPPAALVRGRQPVLSWRAWRSCRPDPWARSDAARVAAWQRAMPAFGYAP
jgi:hypothetical protein